MVLSPHVSLTDMQCLSLALTSYQLPQLAEVDSLRYLGMMPLAL
jgi:hypothetical protein